jgi:hypothetical protein
VTKAEDVLIAVGERIRLSIHDLIAADFVMGQDGLASVRAAVTMLEQASKLIAGYQATSAALPQSRGRHAIDGRVDAAPCDECGIDWRRHGEQCGIEHSHGYAR